MRKRNPTPTELEFEYLHAPEPRWKRFLGRSAARVCLDPKCGAVSGPRTPTCPECGSWDLADLFRDERAIRRRHAA